MRHDKIAGSRISSKFSKFPYFSRHRNNDRGGVSGAEQPTSENHKLTESNKQNGEEKVNKWECEITGTEQCTSDQRKLDSLSHLRPSPPPAVSGTFRSPGPE